MKSIFFFHLISDDCSSKLRKTEKLKTSLFWVNNNICFIVQSLEENLLVENWRTITFQNHLIFKESKLISKLVQFYFDFATINFKFGRCVIWFMCSEEPSFWWIGRTRFLPFYFTKFLQHVSCQWQLTRISRNYED